MAIVQREQFDNTPDGNLDLISLQTFTNLGKVAKDHWYADASHTGTIFSLYTYKVDGITGETTLMNTDVRDFGVGVDTLSIDGFSTTTILDNNIYCVYAIRANEIATGNTPFEYRMVYSTDAGATWTSYIFNPGVWTGTPEIATSKNCFKLISTFWALSTYDTGSTKYVYFNDVPLTSSANVSGITVTDALYQGSVHNDLYYFVYHNGSNFLLNSFDGTTITLEETLSASLQVPTTWNSDVQRYIRQGNSEALIDEDHFYYRKIGDLEWSQFSSTAEKMNGIIYTYGADGNPIVKEVLWRFGVYEYETSGAIGLIQRLDPRDYKKDLITFEQLQGVMYFGDDRYPELEAWTETFDSFKIVESQNTHQYPLYLKRTGVSTQSARIEFAEDQIDGTVAFNIYIPNSDKQINISLRDPTDSAPIIQIIFDVDGLIDFSGASTDTDIQAYEINKWFTIKIEWVKDGTAKLYYNDLLTEISSVTANDFDAAYFKISALTTGAELYIDSISYSWLGGDANKIKPITAYVGWDNWFTDGNNQIYLLDWRNFIQNKCETAGALYMKPTAEILSINRPFKDQYLKLFNKYLQPVTHGFVRSNEDVTWEFKYEMETGIAVDYREKINMEFVDKTTSEVLREVIDTYCKFVKYGKGTNGKVNKFTPEQAGGSATNWANADSGTNVLTSYINKKQFVNGIMYDLLQFYDNSTNFCRLDVTNQSFTTFSINFATNDTNKGFTIQFFEDGTRIGILEQSGNNLNWYDGSSNLIQAVSADTIYHIAFVVRTTEIDIYIDGEFNSTQGLENNFNNDIDHIRWQTFSTPSTYSGWYSDMYIGTSLVEAMNTYDSISPLPTTLHSVSFNNKTLPDVMKWASNFEGFMTSIRPDGQFYFDQFAPGYIDNPDENFVDWGTYKNSPFNTWDYKTGLHGQNCLQFGTYDNADLDDWNDETAGSCNISVGAAIDRHKNIMKLDDQDSSERCEIKYSFGSITSGEIEFWMRTSNVAQISYVYISDGAVSDGVYFRIAGGFFQDGTTNTNIVAAVNDTWYHVKIAFNTTNWTPTLNGTSYATFSVQGSPSDFDLLTLWSRVSASNYQIYYDGFGFVGIDDYEVNDNKYVKDWLVKNNTGCSSSIISLIGEKCNSLEFKDESSSGNCHAEIEFVEQTDGEITFKIRSSDVTKGTLINIRTDGSEAIQIKIDADKIQYYYGAAWNDATDGAAIDFTWYKFKIDFDCATDTYDFYLDGKLLDSGVAFSNVQTDINQLVIRTDSTDTAYKSSFHHFGFSWDEYARPSRTLQYLDELVTGSTVEPIIKNQNTGFSRIVIFGGYSAGQPLKTIILGEPNLGSWYDWFSEVGNQTDLDALGAKIAADKLVTVRKSKTGLISQGNIYHGTYIDLTLDSYNIINKPWLVLSDHYDARIDETRFVMADSYYSPSTGESDQQVNENTERTRNNEQNIGSMETKHQSNQSTQITIPIDDTTPNISLGSKFTTSVNTTPTVITDLDNPKPGQEITIFGGSTDANSSTIADSPPFYLSGAWTANLYDSIKLYVFDITHFIETGRSNV